MFKKTIGLAAAALAISGFAVLGNGCSSSSSSTTTDGGSEGDGAVVHKDAGGGTDGGGTTEAPACYDLADAQIGLNGETAPKAAQGVCTSTEISDFFGLCLGESDAADAGGACSDYIDAHANCASCILGPQTADAGAFPVPALVFVSSTSVSVNVPGCFAAVTTGVDDTCRLAFSENSTCIESACASCEDADFDACTTYADADEAGCSSAVPVDSTCSDAINASASDTTLAAKCTPSAASPGFQDYYTTVVTTLCGS